MSKSKFDSLEKFVCVTPEGRTMRVSINVTDLGVRDDLLLKAAGEAAGVPIHGLCHLPGSNPPMTVHFYAAANIGMAVRLPMLRMNTFWTIDEKDSVIVPSFNSPNSIDRTMDWTPPEGCSIYLVVRQSIPYLVALGTHPERGTWRAIRLDLPNIYADGKLCMGRDFAPPDTGNYVDRVRKYVDSIFTTRWNTHLMDAGGGDHERWATSKKLIRFSPDGHVLAPTVPWYTCGKEISGSAYNWLVAMAQARRQAPA